MRGNAFFSQQLRWGLLKDCITGVVGAVFFVTCSVGDAGDPCAPHPSVAAALSQIEGVVQAGPFQASWKSLERYEVPQWYKDAKFGIFVHWGVYSVPAYGSEWYPRQMYIDAKRRGENFFQYHKETFGDQSEFGYKDFIPRFKAEKFDPDDWAKLFAAAGAKYVVPVAEHHDGFPMYACSFTEWDASEMGPKRDVVAELATAIRSQGMKFGVSSHRAFNWKYFVRRPGFDNADPQYAGLYGRPLPFLFKDDAADYQKRFEPQDTQFKDDWLARTCELVDTFNPDLVWFDFGIARRDEGYEENPFAGHLQKFAAYYYNVTSKRSGPVGIINYKWNAFPENAAVLDLERSKMDSIRVPFWQTDTAVSSSSWGYTKNQKYKTVDRIVDDLVDIVAKNGCLLLNVGPRADGTIPAEDREILLEIGQWLQVNGEAIYGTTYWDTYGEGPTKTETGHLAEKHDKRFTAEDLRFTKKADSLYVIVLDRPAGWLTVRSLSSHEKSFGEIASIELLGSDAAVEWKRDAEGLHVSFEAPPELDYAYVFKITPMRTGAVQ
jgi:alpha-L-fucosidase